MRSTECCPAPSQFLPCRGESDRRAVFKDVSAVLAYLLAFTSRAPLAGQPQRIPWQEPITVQILLFPQVQIIDFAGPWEAFGQAGYRVHTVAKSTQTLTTSMGMKITPDFALAEAPPADIIVVPGGGLPHRLPSDDPMVTWLQAQAPQAKIVLTICNGAFLLGSAGLSENLRMTTTAGMIDHLHGYAPGSKPVFTERFVQDGKFVTAGGLSAGIDAALHVISQIDSTGRAQEVANNMEYHWQTKDAYVRTRLADFGLNRVLDFNPPLRKQVIRYAGNDQEWVAEFIVQRPESLAAFSGKFGEMARAEGWSRTESSRTEKEFQAEWTFKKFDGTPFRARTSIQSTPVAGQIRMTVSLEKTTLKERGHDSK